MEKQRIMLNVGTSDVMDEQWEMESDFGFTVVFPDGSRFEASFEVPSQPFEPHEREVLVSMFDKDDTLMRRVTFQADRKVTA